MRRRLASRGEQEDGGQRLQRISGGEGGPVWLVVRKRVAELLHACKLADTWLMQPLRPPAWFTLLCLLFHLLPLFSKSLEPQQELMQVA